MRSDSSHPIINMNQHHPSHQEDSKDSLIVQQQVQHQELMEQHQQQQDLQQQDDEVSFCSKKNFFSLYLFNITNSYTEAL